MDLFATIAGFFRGGGPFMYVILGVGVLMVAIVVERFLVIGRASRINTSRFVADLQACLEKGDVARARELCRGTTPAVRVAAAILGDGSGDQQRLQNTADGAATLALPRLTKRLPHLNTLANTATLLGLLGTIFGLTTAFSAVGAADPAQRSAFLAAGISQALSTTAFGLIVAVPALLAHGFLVGKVEGVVADVDEVSVRLVKQMSRPRMTTAGTSAPGLAQSTAARATAPRLAPPAPAAGTPRRGAA